MLITGMGDQPILTPDGVTHRVRTMPNGVLSGRTSCGTDWRKIGTWLTYAGPTEINCMACISDETQP
jgi:hypothetical protein